MFVMVRTCVETVLKSTIQELGEVQPLRLGPCTLADYIVRIQLILTVAIVVLCGVLPRVQSISLSYPRVPILACPMTVHNWSYLRSLRTG